MQMLEVPKPSHKLLLCLDLSYLGINFWRVYFVFLFIFWINSFVPLFFFNPHCSGVK
jgi:hypothetical protein